MRVLRRWCLGLTWALLLTCATIAVQAQVPTVRFDEEIGPSLWVDTEPIHSPSAGLVGEQFRVIKLVTNASPWTWLDFHIDLQVLRDDVWVDSDEADGISFDQPTLYETWLQNVLVDVDGVFMPSTSWEVARIDVPYDRLDFTFKDFGVMPGQTLSLHFDMRENDSNTWRLRQTATIPEPGTSALLLGAGLGVLVPLLRRRR